MKINLDDYLVCPECHSGLGFIKDIAYKCKGCGVDYPIVAQGVPNFLTYEVRDAKLIDTESGSQLGWAPGLRYWTPGYFIKLLQFGYGNEREREAIDIASVMLDVGCGGNAQGHINTDVYIPDPLPKNFVLASAEKLPFKSDSIDIVRSAYVIEHNPHPALMLREHVRICKDKVIAYTDNSDWLGAILLRVFNTGYIFHDEHYYKWSKEYMINLVRRLNFKGEVTLFNGSPSIFVKLFSLFKVIPRVAPLFLRDLKVVIKK